MRSLLLALLLMVSLEARAGSIEPREASLQLGEESLVLAADFAIDLGPRLEDALQRGVSLHFVLEFVLERPRKYWVPEHVVTRVANYRLAYSHLTRQYRVTSGGLHQNLATLADALRLIGRVGAMPVAEKALLKPGEPYQAAIRLSLDRSQLPKPFQIDAITDREWQVEAGTRRWTYTP